MWLISSSIGRKFIMALTGACLVLFVTFHSVMNAVAIVWPNAYNVICEFLGANWYALIASAGLAALFIIHIIYAVWLTFQNRKARGADRYAINGRPHQVEWSSKNMLVLGIFILAFLVVHLIQFWSKMQMRELISHNPEVWTTLDGAPVSPAMGTLHLQIAFSAWWTLLVYMIGIVALWFHMTHGFWSMFQSVGWNGKIWLPRLRRLSYWWTTIFVGLFAAEAIVFTVQAHQNHYLTDPTLQEQYAEVWSDKAEELLNNFAVEQSTIVDQATQQAFINNYLPKFYDEAQAILDAYDKQAPAVTTPMIANLRQAAQQIGQIVEANSQAFMGSGDEIMESEEVEVIEGDVN